MIVALVTGANKGVGLAVARALGRHGIKVWLGARSEKHGLAAAAQLRLEAINVEYLHLDVTNAASICAAAERIEAAYGTLDILVNNAGIMNEMRVGTLEPMAPSQLPITKIRELYDTNLFVAIQVTQCLLPLLRKSAAGRIVNVSARFGSFGHQTDEDWLPRSINLLGYASSKAALNMATVAFAYELRNTRIKVNAVTPGTIATDLSGIKADDLTGKPGYGTPEEGAQIIVKYTLLPDSGPTGRFFGPDGELPW